MKMKKLVKGQKKMKRAVRKLAAKPADNPGWVAALSAIAGAVAAALSDESKRDRMKEVATTGKDRARRLVRKHPKEEREEAQNGMVMDENPGPV
ncbi:MAG TPA: hypothetical protein VM925_05010 [Labilithrix sp.]|jgi:hypothetical protein|nr:hypothetical protein [Labilithrix sp.]